MTRMIRSLLALSVVGLATACASPDPMAGGPMMHGSANGMAGMPMQGMAPRMQAMQAIHQKMMAAKTPAERQALMAEHTRAMQDGMAMMQAQNAMPGMGGMAGMSEGGCKPGEMAGQHRRMGDHHAMMQMMMDMMADRVPATPAAP